MAATAVAFYDRDESEFYGECVEEFLRHGSGEPGKDPIAEFGVGSGVAICGVLHRTGYRGRIEGYELNPDSCLVAARTIGERGLASRYRVANADFFEAAAELPRSVSVIANPPYLPSAEQETCYPVLSGGATGNSVTNKVIAAGFRGIMMMVSSYSDPLRTMELAAASGYSLVRWTARPLRLGEYSRRPRVARQIGQLAAGGRAFLRRDEEYLLVGVTWQRDCDAAKDRSAELIAALRRFAAAPAAQPDEHVIYDARAGSSSW